MSLTENHDGVSPQCKRSVEKNFIAANTLQLLAWRVAVPASAACLTCSVWACGLLMETSEGPNLSDLNQELFPLLSPTTFLYIHFSCLGFSTILSTFPQFITVSKLFFSISGVIRETRVCVKSSGLLTSSGRIPFAPIKRK